MRYDQESDRERESSRGAFAVSKCADALVFSIVDPGMVAPTVESFRESGETPGALGAVLEYVTRFRGEGAELTPIYPERAVDVLPYRSPGPPIELGWQVAVPDLRPDRELSAYHYLQLASPEHGAHLLSLLRGDAGIGVAYHPAFHYSLNPGPGIPFGQLDLQWGLKRCGFQDVWTCLEQGPKPGPIAVLDLGGDLNHDELVGVITEFPPSHGTPSKATHASEVAAVIAAHRDGKGMDGCCSANIHLYNVATTTGFSCKAFLFAMKAVAAAENVRVVNLSLQSDKDVLVEKQVAECIAKGKILVAAIGDSGDAVPVYPAAYPDVIAVGGTYPTELRHAKSTMGKHICLSAPGVHIYTVSGTQGLDTNNNGTSYAAPMVSAAVWLALRAKPDLDLKGIKDLLSKSVFKKGLPFEEVGHGRLDMREMVKELRKMGVALPGCP